MSEIEDKYIEVLNSIKTNQQNDLFENFPSINRLPAGEIPLESESYIQTRIAQNILVQIAAKLPLASVGDCFCGSELRFKNTEDGGVFLCCKGNPEHCIQIK